MKGEESTRRLPDPTRYTPQFVYRSGQLFCQGVPIERVAVRVGTPAYVYSRASIAGAYRRLEASLKRALGPVPHTICYSVKANSNLSILRLIASLDSSFDIVSGGELERLRRIGVSGQRIVYSGVGKTREEIRAALRYASPADHRAGRSGILLFNLESAAELDLLCEEASRIAAKGAARPAAGMRVNPDVEAGGHPHISTGHRRHKFGVDWDEARGLYLAHRNSPWIAWKGISAHIGSQILSLRPFRRALRRLAAYVRELVRAGISLEYFDFGGGLGIRYAAEDPPDTFAYARAVAAAIRPLGCRLLLEPGRVLVGPAGILVTRVLHAKRSRGKTFVVVDAAMNDFLRPALYGAVHPITKVVRASRDSAPSIRADIVGPVCETSDVFVEEWPLETVQPGDLLAIWGTGAYGFVASSNYNSRPRPPEVLIERNRFRVIRGRESWDDLVRGE